MRNYEAMFIFEPRLREDKLEKEINSVQTIIKKYDTERIDYVNMGKKTLAYPIQKLNEGFYVNYNFQTRPSAITKIKAALKHRKDIIRFMIFLKEKRR